MNELAILSLLVTLIFTEVTQIIPGGIVVPFYFALYLEEPVKVAATLDISLCTVYAELKRGQAIDSEGEVVLDKNFRPAYSAERGQSTYNRNLRNRGRRPKRQASERSE